MDESEERRVLETLSTPIEHDLRHAYPQARIEWAPEEGEWWYRVFGSMATFDSVGEVDEPLDEGDRQSAILSIAWNISYNLWPDEWTDPWPACPMHGDHPLEPEMWRGKAAWVCVHDKSVGRLIGSLDGTFRRRTR
ncbi:MAG: hypothetical protein ACRD2W_15885 [Acidimicrobiales bacterium]